MKKIALALHNVMTKVSYVQKDAKNNFHGYKYASESALLEKLRPAMIEEGLILIPSVSKTTEIDEYGNTNVTIEYTLVHKDGEIWPEKIYACGSGNDKNKQGGVGDKGLYKAITGANKYLLFKLFQIETGDDPETEKEPPPPPAEEHDEPKQKSKTAKKVTEKDLKTYVEVCGFAISKAANVSEVRDHWKEQASNRIELGITPGTNTYDSLKAMCAERVAVLQDPATAMDE